MPLANIYFNEELDKKLEVLSKKWGIAKYQVVVKIISEYNDGI